ncbi:hypothetical protein C8R45DRAFT_489991 [Mycena sanguinolenta]|nr:hypothetical protein C8R45DRAFT_489991 [Mycena sanguinolenta]
MINSLANHTEAHRGSYFRPRSDPSLPALFSPRNIRNLRRKRRRNINATRNTSTTQTHGGRKQPKRTRTNVNGDSLAKRARTAAANTEFVNVSITGGAGGVSGRNGGIAAAPVSNLNVFYFQCSAIRPKLFAYIFSRKIILGLEPVYTGRAEPPIPCKQDSFRLSDFRAYRNP